MSEEGLARRRVKLEFDDGEGGKYTITLEGSISRDKVLKLMDMVELLGGGGEAEPQAPSEDTLLGRIYRLVERRFPLGSFTSTDLLEAYEDEYGRPVKLSTVSTYLQRLCERGVLRRERSASGSWSYRRMRLRAG